MDFIRRSTAISWWPGGRAFLSVETVITALTLTMIAVFHSSASEDRLLLNLYYVGIAAAAYALVQRRAMAAATFVLAVTAGTTLANDYFSAKSEKGDPLLDFTSWCVLLLLCWRLAVQSYNLQAQERRLEMQRELDEKAAAMRASALVCTSHEVRTPLTGILSFTEMLQDNTAGPLTELQKDFVGEIDRCGQHLMNLVNDILDYAKAQAGLINLSLETVALPELVDQCVAMVEGPANKTEVKLTKQVEPALREIVADPLRLKQILLNLLSNAVKFSPSSGLVRIQVRPSGNDVLISVRDTGRGICDEEMGHLFDPYHQGADEDSRTGTGLGLGITKMLVELHGGSIAVESAPDLGSLFTVRLPRSGPPEPDDVHATEGERNWADATRLEEVQADPLFEVEAGGVLE